MWACYDKPWVWSRHPAMQKMSNSYDTFEPLECSLDSLSGADDLWQLLGNRTIYFLGDSTSEQHWDALICELGAHGMQLRSKPIDDLRTCGHFHDPPSVDDLFLDKLSNFSCFDMQNALKGRLCCSPIRWCYEAWMGGPNRSPEERIGDTSVTLCWASVAYAYSAPLARGTFATATRAGLGARDVIVTNHGLHFNQNAERLLEFRVHHAEFAWVVEHLLKERAQGRALPHIVWRESAQQHFSTPAGTGWYHVEWQQVPCGHIKNVSNLMSRITEPAMEALNIPMMRVWDASVARYFEHPYDLEVTGYFDCTHYCMPSAVLRHWNRVLLHHIRTLSLDRA